jgi:site-specific recombinase XerD
MAGGSGRLLSRINSHLESRQIIRHTYATGALKAGLNPKVISERIGHADVGFFLQTYAHVVRSDDRDAAEQAAAFLIGDQWTPSEHES